MPNRGHEQMFSVVMSNFIDALGIKTIETGIILSIVDINIIPFCVEKVLDQTTATIVLHMAAFHTC